MACPRITNQAFAIGGTCVNAKNADFIESERCFESPLRAVFKYDVYLFYEPDLAYLKATALTLDIARSLPKGSGKRRLVFAPTKYLDSIHLEENRIDFCQLPFEIYKAARPKKA